MRMLIVGAGAIGGYYGARLANAGRDVTFLVRPKRAAQLKQAGLQVKSPNGDLTIQPQLVTADAPKGPYDAILLAVKAFSLEPVLNDLAATVGPETMILPVLNGMKHVEILSAQFGAHAVAGCACRIAVELDEEGCVVQLNPPNDMAYGEMDGSASARMTALDGFMQNAGFNARLSPAIAREMWEKWILLAGLGGTNCLMRGSIGEVEAAPGGVTFVETLLDEIIAVVKAAGVPPSQDFIAFVHKVLTARDSQMTSSMYRDLLKGARIEGDQIIGDLLARGARAGLATPMIAAIYANLSVYQARLRSS
jgi:2-dehydropantoate 2-reductase